MNSFSRRKFLSNTAIITAGVPLFNTMTNAAAGGGSPNDAIQVGVIGIGWKGEGHVKDLLETKGVRIVALCDADRENLAKGQSLLRERGIKAREYLDMRHMMDDPAVEAVVIATPNHWHALATVWACQAGKDVYVEKPVTHNLWEGKKMVEAARKYGRMVQAGTQNRSDKGFNEAMQYIREGHMGEIQWTHGFWYKYRESGEPVTGPQSIPGSVDYDLWTGPAPLAPLMRENLHYDWHWNWDTGNGDLGNLGGHKVDDSLNIIGENNLPVRFLCIGGLYGHQDGWQTPNIQAAFIEYDNKPPVIVDIRSLPAKAGAKYETSLRDARKGSIIQCEDGYFTGGRGGGILYDNDGNRIKQFPGDGGKTHMDNWFQAIRSRDRSRLIAEIEISVNSANVCHLSNLAYRSGLPCSKDEILGRVGHYDHAIETVVGMYSQLEANNIDPGKYPLTVSEWMSCDPATMQLSGSNEYSSSIANYLAKPAYRDPFIIPEKV